MATRKKNVKDHTARKDQGQAEKYRKERKARNESRPKQRWVPSSFTGTLAELDALTPEQVAAIVPAHWERP